MVWFLYRALPRELFLRRSVHTPRIFGRGQFFISFFYFSIFVPRSKDEGVARADARSTLKLQVVLVS